MGNWTDDMNRAMEDHPEWFGMVIDEMGNPVDAPKPKEESEHMKKYGPHDCRGGVEGDLSPF